MSRLDKLQPLLILIAVVIGLVAAPHSAFRTIGAHTILPALQVMLLLLFFSLPLGEMKKAIRSFKVTGSSLIINFIITPIVAYILGWLFLTDAPLLRIGLMLLLVTPCTDWYLVFTGLSRGNVPLALSLLPLNLVFQLVLLPVYLGVFFGEAIGIDVLEIFYSIVRVLVLPFAGAIVLRIVLNRRFGTGYVKTRFVQSASLIQIIFLCVAIAAMFASRGIAMFEQADVMIRLLVPLILFFLITFIIAFGYARIISLQKRDRTTLLFTTLARNSPLALAIAASVFPHQPHIAMVLIIGALIELPVLGLLSSLITRFGEKW